MSIRAIATLVIAVVLGLIAVLIVNAVVNRPPPPPPPPSAAPPPSTPVIVAAKPITRGETVTPDLLKIVPFPAGAAPDGSFQTVAQLTGPTGGPRMMIRDLSPGEPVLATRVTAPGQKINLSDIIPYGMQAVSLRTGDISGVAGFILPGDHVDVLMTRTTTPPPGGPPTTVVQVVLADVKVLAIDQDDNDEATGVRRGSVMTLLVTPAQAQTITLAQTIGSVSFSLRHVLDKRRVTRVATPAYALDLYHPGPPPPAPAPGVDYGLVRITRATDTAVYQLSSQ